MTWEQAKTLGRITGALLFSLPICAAHGAEPTAFALVQEGNRYVGEDVKDKVLQIRSEKSVDGLTPNIWHIVYYDIHVRTKETKLKFENGKKVDLDHPFRLFVRAGLSSNVVDKSRLRMDSNASLKIAQKDPLLEKLKLTHSRMTLEKWEDAPVWKIAFWAEKASAPGKMVEIGEIFVNAEDGKVVHRNLRIERAQ